MREFSVDMIPGGAQTAVACNQYESGDTWVFALYYDGGRYSIPEDAEVSITGTKPDGAAYNIAGSVVDNAVVITVTDQITACAGRSIAEILVESETDGTTLYSANFPLLVEPAAVQGEFNPSEIPSAIVDTDGNVYYSAEYIPEVSGGVPTEVRQAMKTLFEKAAYIETGLADEVAVVQAWAEATTSITVSPTTASVSSASPTAQLSAVTTPAGGAVTWASSNSAVATVSPTGLVTAVGNGTAVITARSGDVSASCAVTVTGFATLTGITATYTQSGTVYDTASLDDLRADLVVTGSYDDSSTETITDYTLSGTLAVGTSTITVSYGGFTDTFTVTVTDVPNYVTDGLQGYWDFTDVEDGTFGTLTNLASDGDLMAEAIYQHNGGSNLPLAGFKDGEFLSTTSYISGMYTDVCHTLIRISTTENTPVFYTDYPYSVEWYGKFIGSQYTGSGYNRAFAYATAVAIAPSIINTRNNANSETSVVNVGGQGTVIVVQDGSYKTYGSLGQGNNTIEHSGMTPESYHHYVITVAKTSIKIYVDGVLIGEGTATNNNSASATYGLLLGTYTSIKFARVYNKILSAEEVATNYGDIGVA